MKKRIFKEDIENLGENKLRVLRKLKKLQKGDFILCERSQNEYCILSIHEKQIESVDEINNLGFDNLYDYDIKVGNREESFIRFKKNEVTPLFSVGDMIEIIEKFEVEWACGISKQGDKILTARSDKIKLYVYGFRFKSQLDYKFYNKEYIITPNLCIALFKVIEDIIELLEY